MNDVLPLVNDVLPLDMRAKCANEGCINEITTEKSRGHLKRFCSSACKQKVYRNTKANKSCFTINGEGCTLADIRNTILRGDALSILRQFPDQCVQCCVTSPPYYGLRSYLPDGHPGKPLEVGLEDTPESYVDHLMSILREVRRTLRKDGVLWLNMGDSYAGSGKGGQPAMYSQHWQPIYAHKRTVYPGLAAKQLLGIPWRVALALQADGWYLRSDVIWHKVNCVPESVLDRPTRSHEYVFLFSKQKRYYYDQKAIQEPGAQSHKRKGDSAWLEKNRRSVWSIPTQGLAMAHCATMSPHLAELCILAGSRPSDLILDPFMGAGTTAIVALQHERTYLGIEINAEYVCLANKRLAIWQHQVSQDV